MGKIAGEMKALLVIWGLISLIRPIPVEGGDRRMEVRLPSPKYKSSTSIEETLLKRRSIRDYKDEPLTLEEVSQLLWAAQGITKNGVYRTAPSAGATYPLEVYVVCGKVKGLERGLYHYDPEKHTLKRISSRDLRQELAYACYNQYFVGSAPLSLVFTAVYERTTGKYGRRGIRYVHMEVGHSAQNVYLQCESLGLGTVVVGAFNDDQVKKVLSLPRQEVPLYVMPVGKVKQE